MRNTLLMVAAGVSIAATPAAADNWRRIGETGSAPTRIEFYVNVDSIHRTGDTLTVSTATVYETSTARKYTHAMMFRTVDCAASMSQITMGKFYNGDSLVSTDDQAADRVAPSQGSVGYDIVMAVCGKADYFGPPVSDPVAASRTIFSGAATQ